MTIRFRWMTAEWEPDWVVHPGETLREMLEERRWLQSQLATLCGVTEKHISRVITGQSGIGVDFALRLERVLGVNARVWMRMQVDYDVGVARKASPYHTPSSRTTSTSTSGKEP